MAKGKGSKGGLRTPGLKEGLKTIGVLGKQMGKERMADYNVALSASFAGSAGLARQISRLEKNTLGVTNRFVTRSLGREVAQARALRGRTRSGEKEQSVRYGKALGDYAGTVFRPAQVQARSNLQVQGALARQGATGVAVGRDAARMAQQGAVAQQGAAAYALAQALQQRTIVDNETLASLTGQMYQSALEYNMQWEMWKKQQEYAAKQAEKEADLSKEDVLHLGERVPDLANSVFNHIQEAREKSAGPINLAQVIQSWAEQNAITDEGELAVATAIARNIKADMTPSAAAAKAIEDIYGGTKGYQKFGPELAAGVESGTMAIRGEAFEKKESQQLEGFQQKITDLSEDELAKLFMSDLPEAVKELIRQELAQRQEAGTVAWGGNA